ncbi:Response regulator of zinc sigma-54-dependent two-component system [hydrothermal vent metagenome]|uniref:Response regulator of zinc sigma-54-dependent two-component system n=1 Tax=hydrothermal vent metagenome TaxID=652676 RepID=A0A3B0YCP2_9ZZZZ
MEKIPLILFIDDDPKAGELMLRFAEDAPFGVRVFCDPRQALEFYKENTADLIVTDLRMPGLTGIELLREVRALNTQIPVIIITAHSTVDNAIDALRLGASDFIKKPFDMDELMILIERGLEHSRLKQENRLLKRQLRDEKQRYGMLGKSSCMQEIYSIIDKIADIRCNVIIEGESGTGKELAARAIHDQSQNADKAFVVIDCGALSDTLLESELFGHEKGAFTGATASKQGLLEAATGGTVFLDEICNISDNMQTKLLRVVQEQQITKVGGVKPIKIDVRFIVATNRNLEQMVTSGGFRHDLYHRLNVVKMILPPLRDRRDDVPELIKHFVLQLSNHYGRLITGFDSASMSRLCDYDWPGNVRELRNLVERHIALADGEVLEIAELSSNIGKISKGDEIDGDYPSLDELEKRYIEKVLNKYNGNREKTAKTLNINKSTLWRKLQQYNQ